MLAVDEAAANAVLHAYGPDESGAVELTLWTEQGRGADATLSIEIVDHGQLATAGRAEPHVGGGRGIPLMSNVAEAVLIHYDDRGSRVLLRHPVPARPGPGGGPERGRRRHDRAAAPQDGPPPAASGAGRPEVPSRAGRASRGSGVGAQRPSTGA